jgi:hypothetical protein
LADKDFKVKSGLDLGTPLPLTEGGTGQTSASNALNALLPVQTDNVSKFLQTNGTSTTWAITPGYTQIGSINNYLSSRGKINFYGVDLVDDSGNNATNVIINLAATGLDGGRVDSVSLYDGGEPSTNSFMYAIEGGTP